MAHIKISERVKPFLSDQDEFELIIHSSDESKRTITVDADGDLFSFKVINDDGDPDGWIIASAKSIKVRMIDSVTYKIDALYDESGSEITSKSSVVAEEYLEETSTESQPDQDVKCNVCGVGSAASGCEFKRLNKQMW